MRFILLLLAVLLSATFSADASRRDDLAAGLIRTGAGTLTLTGTTTAPATFFGRHRRRDRLENSGQTVSGGTLTLSSGSVFFTNANNGAFGTAPYEVSNEGLVVNNSSPITLNSTSNVAGTVALGSGTQLTLAQSVNSGSLISNGQLNSFQVTDMGSVAAVPEPATGALLLAGLAGMALKRRR